MNFSETIFMLSFLIIIGITLLKIFNLFNQAKFYDLKICFLLTVSFILCYGTSFVTMIIGYDQLIFLQLFRLETLLVIPNIIFLLAELFLEWGYVGTKRIKAYKSNQNGN